METGVGCSFSGCCSPHAGHVAGSGYHGNPQPTPAARVAGTERARKPSGGREEQSGTVAVRGGRCDFCLAALTAICLRMQLPRSDVGAPSDASLHRSVCSLVSFRL